MHITLRHGGGDGLGDVGRQERRVLLAGLGPAGQLGQLHPSDGSVDVSHAVVETNVLVGVTLLHALVAEHGSLTGDFRVRGGDHATLARGHVLRRVEGESSKGAKSTDMLAVDAGSVGLGTILEDLETVLCGDRDNFGHVSRETIEVHRHDRGGLVGNRGLDGSRVEGKRDRVDVSEHRLGAGQGYRVAGSGESEGRDDDLVALTDARGQQANVEGRGSRVDGDAVNPVDDLGGELVLEGVDLGALGDHAGGNNLVDGLTLVIAEDRLSGRNELGGHVKAPNYSDGRSGLWAP